MAETLRPAAASGHVMPPRPAIAWTLAMIAVPTSVLLRAVFTSTRLAAPPEIALLGSGVVVALLVAWINPRLSLDGHGTAAIAGLAAVPLFYALRTNVLNADGTMLTPKFERDVPALGAHLTHDELLELFVHSRVWYYTHRWWGWSVVHSYQVVSCIAGGIAVYGLVRLARRVAPDRSWIFLAGIASGGYMQLFFGDVENYTIAVALIVLYVVAACRFLSRDAPLWMPAAALAAAACFHLEAAWLLPSAVYLATISRRRTGTWNESRTSGAVGLFIVAAVFVYFQFHGLPLIRFFSSHAGHALRGRDVFALGMPRDYYVAQARLLLILCPAVLALLPLLAFRRHAADDVSRFLAIAAASMLLLQIVWKSQIGVFEDWNLYSAGGLLLSVVIWRRLAATADGTLARGAAAALAVIAALHTYSWILANHRAGG